MQRQLILLASLWSIFVTTSPCHGDEPSSNEAAPLRGTVIDDYNDQPIAGAAVIVTWGLESRAEPLPGGSAQGSAVAVSDQAGRFEFSQEKLPIVFGPQTRVILQCVAPGYGGIRDQYAAAGENTVALKARHRMKRDLCLVTTGIWHVEEPEFSELAQQANAARAKTGLVPIDLRENPEVACPPESRNQWGPFIGRVVDKHTEQPIPGAICSAVWLRVIPFPFEGVERFFDARVSVADGQGHFEIPRCSPPFLFLGVKHPYLSCMSPGYKPYEDVGPENGTISVRLRPLSEKERKQRQNGWSSFIGSIPMDKQHEFERAINQRWA